eukprot:CAMPEP_0181232418 /NCGR_PEP_ID=MMETSP1096-20121128/35719_1 /TAXON_ID=156174 ORGANISM="Chrysochromulina ericina, Strain CCMP281" /NCGR_SAMPLE_ID=MMETSP1096 /ASSEMBLY_ACC=CAM_ASM_000453 /LENGTH=158 /DNA_ID=CAMNT_0023326705 /DNA_START=305 /DNA_END=779 /DNA_ORIENTATION=-
MAEVKAPAKVLKQLIEFSSKPDTKHHYSCIHDRSWARHHGRSGQQAQMVDIAQHAHVGIEEDHTVLCSEAKVESVQLGKGAAMEGLAHQGTLMGGIGCIRTPRRSSAASAVRLRLPETSKYIPSEQLTVEGLPPGDADAAAASNKQSRGDGTSICLIA